MAAPPSKTIKDLNGKWVMNKTLSDPFDPLLALQGVGWLTRKAISLATITLTITHFIDASNITHIDIAQVATGGLGATMEKRALDWMVREHKDNIFGEVLGKSRWADEATLRTSFGDGAADQEDLAFFSKGWLEEDGGERVQAYAQSVGNGWGATQVWGFEMVGEQRYYTRHVVVRKGGEMKRARLVYDFLGERE